MSAITQRRAWTTGPGPSSVLEATTRSITSGATECSVLKTFSEIRFPSVENRSRPVKSIRTGRWSR
jgi:hypothetical protein